MTATQGGLTPQDSASLLAVMTETRDAARAQDPKAARRITRDVILEMFRHPLLVATDGRAPLTRPGPEGGLLVAFTDDDAARAWAAEQHPAAPEVHTALSSQLSSSQGRSLWLEWFEEHDAVAVVLNPAGPLAFVAHAQDCRGARAPLFRRAQPTPESPWLDLEARAAERRRVTELHAALATAQEEGDEQRITALQPEIAEQNRMGSMLWAAEMLILSGHWRLRRDELRLGAVQIFTAGLFLGRFADPYRAIDTLIEAGERFIVFDEEGVSDPEQPDFARTYLAQVAQTLPLLTTGYRAQDIAPFARWRSEDLKGA